MAGFTPGPWELFIYDAGGEWTGWPLSISAKHVHPDKIIVRGGGFYPYKWDASTSQVEAVANAHLIAAAPDMYEALKRIVEACEEPDGSLNFGDLRLADVHNARAALSKASSSTVTEDDGA